MPDEVPHLAVECRPRPPVQRDLAVVRAVAEKVAAAEEPHPHHLVAVGHRADGLSRPAAPRLRGQRRALVVRRGQPASLTAKAVSEVVAKTKAPAKAASKDVAEDKAASPGPTEQE